MVLIYELRRSPKTPEIRAQKIPIVMRPFFAFRQKSLFIAGRTSIGCQKYNNNNIFLYLSDSTSELAT